MAEDEPTPKSTGITHALGALRAWAGKNRRRNLIIGAGFGVLVVATIVSWLMFAEIAAAPEGVTVERALTAVDDGEYDQARSIISQLQASDDLTAADYGGALYVLGALKAHEAEQQWSPERSRGEYFIASQYLEEGRAIGFPTGRKANALYLLGKALIESRQLEKGIDVLRQAINAGAKGQARAHLLLAEAYFYAPKPDYKETVSEIDDALTDSQLGAAERSDALLLRAEALAALGRGEEAQQSVRDAGDQTDPPRRLLVEGKALVTRLESAPLAERYTLAEQATRLLNEALRADKLATSVTQESGFLRARIAELLGGEEKTKEAISAYGELQRSHGAAPSGIAAAFAEGSLHQQANSTEKALNSYRRALDAIEEPLTYRSSLMPLSEVKARVRTAHKRFLDQEQFAAALDLAERVGRLLGQTEKLKLRADTLRDWGDDLVTKGESRLARGQGLNRTGRRRLREAGIAYERLAESQFASREYTENLWSAAQAFQKGQSYTQAIRVLEQYLRHEPVKRNALALLRLGKAHLARGEDDAAIEAFEECLEFHANDASSFSARLECSRSYRAQGDLETAEELLRHNLTRTALTPASPEWRDSKFELGRLLSEAGKNDEAIRELEEAINRYKDRFTDDPHVRLQVRSARYLVAIAHRDAAQEPLRQLRSANTINEQETARSQAHEHLEAALEMFQDVQKEITLANSGDKLDKATLRNCFMLGGDVLFELGRYEEARQSFSSVSTLYQNEPYMLEALLQIHHCWRRQRDRPKALGVIQQSRQLLERLPQDLDFATSTTLSRGEWERLLTQLAMF